MKYTFKGHTLHFSGCPLVMGILNVTPDSFSDGGRFFDHASAVDHARRLIADGAHILDVGGLSTRPGSAPVSVDEELRRTVPVIEALTAGGITVPISIDTYRSEVAQAALKAGASMVNDISGLRFDRAMARVAGDAGAPVILMHIKGTPTDMQRNPSYHALIPEIMDYLRESIGIARNAGIEQVVLDPGIGFGKTFGHNLEIINRLDQFVAMGWPVLVGPSRKAFIGQVLGGLGPDDRMEGTAAVVAACVMKGAHVIRVHDVREMSRVARMAHAVRTESAG
jgi:dihydropteroate synthase